MMLRGYPFSLLAPRWFALALVLSPASTAVAQYATPVQSPSMAWPVPRPTAPGQIVRNPVPSPTTSPSSNSSFPQGAVDAGSVPLGGGTMAPYPPGTAPNGLPPTQLPMNSKDFLRLMEEANAAKGVTIYGGNFPGARPVPKAPVVERPTPIPPAPNPSSQLPTPGPLTFPAAPPGNDLTPASLPQLGTTQPQSAQPPLALNSPQPQIPSSALQVSPNAAGLPPSLPPSLVTQPATNTTIGSGAIQLGTGGAPGAAPQTPTLNPNTLNPNGSEPPWATTGPGMAATDSVPLAPQNFIAPNPTSPNPHSPHASPLHPQPWSQPLPPHANPGSTPVLPQQPQTSWNPSTPVQPNVPNPSQPWNTNATKRTNQDRQARVMASYFSNWLERTGDTNLSYSQGGALGTFGTDQAGRFSLGYMVDPMECYEFSFLGSLSWNRELQSLGPVDSTLQSNDPNWLTHLQQASSQQQFHSATLRSYSLHKRLITDELGNSYFGLGVIDYDEQYSLRSQSPNGAASMNIDTSNLWVGTQAGLELWRPLSQRLSIGAQANGGLYANFADADWRADSGTGLTLNTSADKWNLAFLVGVNARARYRFNSFCAAYGGYEWTYLGGLATVDEQPIQTLSTTPSWNMTTNAGFLLQGAHCGLEFQY